MKTNNIWANKFKPTNQFEKYNELRNSKEVNDTIMVFAYSALMFIAGAMSCYIFMRG